jgi:hypothetical protein
MRTGYGINWGQVHRVLSQRGGKKFLKSAVDDLSRLASEDVIVIQKNLDNFEKKNMDGEWD